MNKEKNEGIKKILSKSSVGIAGLGGLGSNATVALARAGIGRLVIVDFDKVEESNLSRQYYFIGQVGKPKTLALQENIKKINSKVIIDSYNEKLQKGTMEKRFRNVDIIIEALDSAETKVTFIEEILTKLPDKPLIAASGVAGYGHLDQIKTKKFGNLYICYDENALSCDDDVLMAPRVAVMANWEADLAIEIILGENK